MPMGGGGLTRMAMQSEMERGMKGGKKKATGKMKAGAKTKGKKPCPPKGY